MYAISPKLTGLTLLVVYLLACALVGLMGRNRSLGFWGFFAFSCVISPFFTFLLLVLTQTRDRVTGRRFKRA